MRTQRCKCCVSLKDGDVFEKPFMKERRRVQKFSSGFGRAASLPSVRRRQEPAKPLERQEPHSGSDFKLAVSCLMAALHVSG